MFIQKRLCDKASDRVCVYCMRAHHCPPLVTHVPLLTTNRELYHEGHNKNIVSDDAYLQNTAYSSYIRRKRSREEKRVGNKLRKGRTSHRVRTHNSSDSCFSLLIYTCLKTF